MTKISVGALVAYQKPFASPEALVPAPAIAHDTGIELLILFLRGPVIVLVLFSIGMLLDLDGDGGRLD